ncbi:MAG: PLP-dependent aspartate aminotransferase family protein [Oscillospiraceae bacterium]|nr:PLP-dependent aspartate aminotransferase family protein [Oscillospiraceae bacterium]
MFDDKDDDMILTHYGEDPSRYFGAVIPPIFMNSLHVKQNFDDLYALGCDESANYSYGRVANPTVEHVEKKLAALERGCKALCFGSGMAAISTAVLNSTRTGSHIVCVMNAYGPTRHFLDAICRDRFGMTVTYVRGVDPAEIEDAIRPETAVIMLESPTTFVFEIIDLAQIAKIARKRGIITIIDNTYCTSLYQKPLELGIDVSVHTATKYFGGHSDIIAGAAAGADPEQMDQMGNQGRALYGGILGPMEGWLMLRGMRTLRIRLEAHQAAAKKVALYLESHPKVSAVHYPGLASHPQHELIRRQQTGSSGLLSFELLGSPEKVKAALDTLRLFQAGPSWGGFESLRVFCVGSDSKQKDWYGCKNNLIRLHVGLEGTANLLADLENALKLL